MKHAMNLLPESKGNILQIIGIKRIFKTSKFKRCVCARAHVFGPSNVGSWMDPTFIDHKEDNKREVEVVFFLGEKK
jgi:hypothetical protein